MLCFWPRRCYGTLNWPSSTSNFCILSESRALKHLCILGSTGSIGTSTLSILEQFPALFTLSSLAAGQNVDLAFSQCLRWRPLVASMATEPLARQLMARLAAAGLSSIEVVFGTEGSVHAATLAEVDFVVSAIVGVSGLQATYAADFAAEF